MDLMTSRSSSDTLATDIKTEDGEPEPAKRRRIIIPHSLNPRPVIGQVGGVPTRFPPYCIRDPADISSGTVLKKFVVDRRCPLILKRDRKEHKDVETLESTSSGLFRQADVQPLNHGAEEGPVRFWRTPGGKLVKLDARSNVRPDGFHRPMGDGVTCSRPKFVRLANGKLARIATRRIPTSFVRPNNPPSNSISREFMTEAERLEGSSAERLECPSATATVTASPGAIDVSTLMGTDPSYSEGSSLFEVRKEESGSIVKTEPLDEEEFNKTQQNSTPAQAPPPQQPSLAAALSNISTSSNEVSDLVRIVDEPLFNPTRSSCTVDECCNVCKKVLPGMKKHLLSVEARLGCLVETVQNLIIQINPKDREAAEAAKAIENDPRTSGNIDEPPRRIPGLSFSRSKDANHGNKGGERSHFEMPLPYKFDIQSNMSGNDESRGTLRPGMMRIIRTVSSAARPQAGAKTITAPRFVVGGTRFIVADRAQASRTVYASHGGTACFGSESNADSNDKKTDVVQGESDDAGPSEAKLYISVIRDLSVNNKHFALSIRLACCAW